MNNPNPMRWKCAKDGCFNELCRPKIEMFSDCFPGRINFSDVDGIVEIGGRGLMLEWKARPNDIPTGQRIMYQRLTKSGLLTVLAVAGDAKTMTVTHSRRFYDGEDQGWQPSNWQIVKGYVMAWAWAQTEPELSAANGTPP